MGHSNDEKHVPHLLRGSDRRVCTDGTVHMTASESDFCEVRVAA
jgi:hypothetical protein